MLSKIYYILLIIFPAVLFPESDIYSQSGLTLKGSVKDSGSHEMLAGAQIRLDQNEEGISTDSEGRFQLSGLSAGCCAKTSTR
ncbi:hypothetical protein D9M68_999780 [compost metagenome]